MVLKDSDELRQAVLSALKKLHVSDSGKALFWTEADAQVLQILLDTGILTREACLNVFDELLQQEGRRAWQTHCKTKDHADHCQPRLMAYAMYRGALSEEEIAQTRFDHGDTMKSFIADAQVFDFPAQVLEKLLTHKDEPPSEHFVTHCVTCC